MDDYLTSINLSNLQALSKSHKPITYKELCKQLEIKYYSGGNSKVAQLDMLTSMCSYHKFGTKYIIDEYYDSVAPLIVNGRSK